MVEVRLEEVTKTFGDVIAANDVTLDIGEGELFFLLGPSGCGKTTTLRLIAGFYQPDQGKIYFNKREVNKVPPNRRNIGMVFQNYALWPHMTVYDNITYGLKVRGIPPNQRVKKTKKVLQTVRMEKYATRYPNQLSGGQQQRIALARALVIEPDVLLFDEPLSNLDAKLRVETRDEIKRIQRTLGVTTIYVTHDQSEALSMADQIAVMNEGQIIQFGTPREIYNNPSNRFVAGFIGETNFLQGMIINNEEKSRTMTVKINKTSIIKAKQSLKRFHENEKVVCSIRPEHIEVTGSKLKKTNFFEATVLNVQYYGFIEHYVLRALGTELKSTNFNPGTKEYKTGDLLYLTFEPENVEVFQLD